MGFAVMKPARPDQRTPIAAPWRRLANVAAAGSPSKEPLIDSRERVSVALADPCPATSLRSAPPIGTQLKRALNVSGTCASTGVAAAPMPKVTINPIA